MTHNFVVTRTVKGDLSTVWARVLRARAFVVAPRGYFNLGRIRDIELRTGEVVQTKILGFPVLEKDWVVETHDRDDNNLVIKGAEGFEDRLLWDHLITIAEAPLAKCCFIQYRAKIPGKRPLISFGIRPRRIFERRHLRICAALEALSTPAPLATHKTTLETSAIAGSAGASFA